MKIEFSHRSVLLNESIAGLNIKPNGIYIDATCGSGGHSYEIASRLEGGRLIGIDQDMAAIAAASKRLEVFGDKALVVHSNFSELSNVCQSLEVSSIDGIIYDLGVSSYQLDEPSRGFAYSSDAPLDMRMDTSRELTAYDVVNGYSEDELRRILYEYGEERFSSRIASKIVREREKKPIRTTFQLSEIVKSAIPQSSKNGGHHPAKRSFQAIRIEVNGELDVIEPAIRQAANLLTSGGRIAVITFHSLEDRIVKQTFQSLSEGCVCPKDFPVCVCGRKPTLKIITRKPVLPSKEELDQNPRSRSAKLRVAERI